MTQKYLVYSHMNLDTGKWIIHGNNYLMLFRRYSCYSTCISYSWIIINYSRVSDSLRLLYSLDSHYLYIYIHLYNIYWNYLHSKLREYSNFRLIHMLRNLIIIQNCNMLLSNYSKKMPPPYSMTHSTHPSTSHTQDS